MKDFNDLYIRVYSEGSSLYMKWQGTLDGELHGCVVGISPIDDYPFAIIRKLQLIVDHMAKYEEMWREKGVKRGKV